MKDYSPSAKRIKNLLGKKTESSFASESKKIEKKRKYQKTVSVPTNNFSTKSKKSSSSKQLKKASVLSSRGGKVPLEQLYCSNNQSYPLFFLRKSGKIKSLQGKEKLIAMRNLKNLTYEMQQWIYAHIAQEVKVYKEKDDEWRDLLEKREERHFQIDRIIKYLSEV